LIYFKNLNFFIKIIKFIIIFSGILKLFSFIILFKPNKNKNLIKKIKKKIKKIKNKNKIKIKSNIIEIKKRFKNRYCYFINILKFKIIKKLLIIFI
jgi:DNA primase catalytic subunit